MDNDSRNIQELYSAFESADNILLKKYVTSLSEFACKELSDDLKTIEVGKNISLYRIARLAYDKDENIQDKLTTVYSTVLSLDNSALILLLQGEQSRVNLFVGVASRNFYRSESEENKKTVLVCDNNLLDNMGKSLKGAFEGIFPGTDLIKVNNVSTGDVVDLKSQTEIISECLDNANFIAAVSSIPTLRNSNEHKNSEFVQGLEKFIDTMRGKVYSAIIIADAVKNDKIETICAGYEDIYSQLAPFKQSSQTLSTTESSTDTESFLKGVTDSTNETIAKSLTHGTATSKTHTDSGSFSANAGIKNVAGVSVSYSHSYSRTKTSSEANTDTTSHGSSKSLTEQNSVARALSTTDGKSIQISYENRAVKTLLDRIDEQIKRLRSCEDFGMFDTCAYFAAQEHDTVVTAASTFKAITRGENSSVESSAVNIWREKNDIECIKQYLLRFYHPEFTLNSAMDYIVTPALLVSGREMAYQMAMPKKSVVGVPVIQCAEFGRDVILSSDEKAKTFELGNIFHMNKLDKNATVGLCKDNLTAHTFITGSTGSGKSTTVYKILNEAKKSNVKFMVVEPAKGEYGNALKSLGVCVYGTNPKLGSLLRINPFRFPSDKIHIYEHLDRLTEIFNVCWPMYAAMPAVLKAAIENAYRNAGWNLIRSENKYGDIFPNFIDVALEVEKYINKSEYSEENKSNYKGSLLTRLESLTNGINGMIFTANDIDDKDLFEENVVIDLSRVGSSETKALIMGILVLKLQEYRMATTEKNNEELKHISVLEEAHNLLKRTSTEQSSETANLLGKSVEMLANSIAEMRTYGEGFIIADQSPGLLDLSVIRNTNTKIIMRLPDYSDRELVGKAANLNDEQIVELAKLPLGVAAVYQSDWVNPVLCKVSAPVFPKRTNFKKGTKPLPTYDNSIVLDMLDAEFRTKIDSIDDLENFKNKVSKSDISTETKIKLINYIKNKSSSHSIDSLASAVYDYFENSKETLESSINELTIEDLRLHIMTTLEPSVFEYDDEIIDSAISLIIKEYVHRYQIDHTVWQDFLIMLEKGEIR